MARPTLAEGFEFWNEEVMLLERPEQPVPYIPVIALVGLYTALHLKPAEQTSYHWRQAVLQNEYAVSGFRQSLQSFFKDSIDDTFLIPIAHLAASNGEASQYRFAYKSLCDGLPSDQLEIPENERFLAQQLGYAAHDHSAAFNPLRLYDQGPVSLRNHYPATAEFLAEQA